MPIFFMARHGLVQADMVLEKEVKVLHLDPQAAVSELCDALGQT